MSSVRVLALATLLLFGVLSRGQEPALGDEVAEESLVVATNLAPPFSMKAADGSWYGISHELWQSLAEDLGVTFDYREMTLDEMLTAVEAGEVDLAVGALTVTGPREAAMDFSHPFFDSGLGIAVKRGKANVAWAALKGLLSWQLFAAVGGLTLLLLAVGALTYLVEHRENEEFDGGVAAGLGNGFWWAAVTMTTVGYGDKAPRTLLGRLLGLVWMFAGIILISGFTAAITSALTLGGMEGDINGPRDLPGHRVATLTGSTSEAYLTRNFIDSVPFESVEQAIEGLEDGAVDAIVYDRPLLQYHASGRYQNMLDIRPQTFETQYYAFAMPSGSPLRERLNVALLERVSGPGWNRVVGRYLEP